MYCTKCGSWMEDYEQFCRECGAEVQSRPSYNADQGQNDIQSYAPMRPNQSIKDETDRPSIGLNILGFLIPIVGIVMFFIKRKQFPKKAKSILIWSIVGWAIWAVINIGILRGGSDNQNQSTNSVISENIILNDESNTKSDEINNIVDTPTRDEQLSTQESETTVSYEVVDIQAMFDELDANALRAERTYQDKYIEVTGKLSVIDSDGKYISICALGDDWGWDSLHCSITDNSQLDIILGKNEGDTLTIKGQVTSIGEIMGYFVDIHEIH